MTQTTMPQGGTGSSAVEAPAAAHVRGTAGRRVCVLLALLLGVGMVVAASPASAAPGAVDRNPACLTGGTLGQVDDAAAQVPIGEQITFGTRTSSTVYVNNNGNLTFGAANSAWLGQVFPRPSNNPPVISPFWADVDTTALVEGKPSVVTWGSTTFAGRPALCVNWTGAGFRGVGYYNRHVDKLDSFQVLLVNREDVAAGAFDIVFNYDKIQWDLGDASPIYPAVGFDAADQVTCYNAPGTVTHGLMDSPTGGLIHRRMGTSTVEGQGIFPIRNGRLGK